VCVILFDTQPPVSAPMHVGDRSTWLNSEALSRDKDIFFEKKKIRLLCTAYSRINVVISKGISVLGENKNFLKKNLEKKSWKENLEKNLENIFRKKNPPSWVM
jgi:hypothetical protein